MPNHPQAEACDSNARRAADEPAPAHGGSKGGCSPGESAAAAAGVVVMVPPGTPAGGMADGTMVQAESGMALPCCLKGPHNFYLA